MFPLKLFQQSCLASGQPFSSFLHTSINFKWKSHRFSMVFSLARTRFYIVKQIVSTVFASFEKVWTINGFGIHFGHILGTFWHTFSIFFGIDFRMPFWIPKILKKSQLGRFWSDFGPKAINQRNLERHFLRLFQEPSFGIDFWVMLGRFGLHFWWFWDDNPTFFSYNSGLHFWCFWDDDSTCFSYNSGLCNHTLA